MTTAASAASTTPAARTSNLIRRPPDGFVDAEVIYLGYPIWWGGAAWPIGGVVKGNDFSGKTVVPFCTSASSPVGSSSQDLAKMAGTGDWRDGKRFSIGAGKDEVADWAQSLGL